MFKSDRFFSQEMLDLMNKYGVLFLPAITVKRNLWKSMQTLTLGHKIVILNFMVL